MEPPKAIHRTRPDRNGRSFVTTMSYTPKGNLIISQSRPESGGSVIVSWRQLEKLYRDLQTLKKSGEEMQPWHGGPLIVV